jgi:hypothetical protein
MVVRELIKASPRAGLAGPPDFFPASGPIGPSGKKLPLLQALGQRRRVFDRELGSWKRRRNGFRKARPPVSRIDLERIATASRQLPWFMQQTAFEALDLDTQLLQASL